MTQGGYTMSHIGFKDWRGSSRNGVQVLDPGPVITKDFRSQPTTPIDTFKDNSLPPSHCAKKRGGDKKDSDTNQANYSSGLGM